MSSIIIDNEFWREFLELFREQPSLWQVKSDLYRNKIQRTKSFRIMLCKLQEVNPAATVEDVKKKLRNLKTTYRREAKKVQDSIRSGPFKKFMPRNFIASEIAIAIAKCMGGSCNPIAAIDCLVCRPL